MKITEISVTKLFNMFDYKIPLNQINHITIVHGPNGSGKTVLLTLLYGLFNSNYTKLRTIPFAEFSVTFDDRSKITVNKTISTDENKKIPMVIYTRIGQEPETFQLKLPKIEDIDFPTSMLSEVVPNLRQIGPRRWVSTLTGEQLSFAEVIERYGEYLPRSVSRTTKEMSWLSEIKKTLDVNFIRTERLTKQIASSNQKRFQVSNELSENMISAADTYSRNLAERIQLVLAEYAQESQSLDRTFPNRLVDRIRHGEIVGKSIEELRDELKELEDKSSRLVEAGLLEKEENVTAIQQIDESTLSVLSIYTEDVRKKLKIFDSMALPQFSGEQKCPLD